MTIRTEVHATDSYLEAIDNLPADAFLGTLLWFSISAADVDLEAARAELQALGLSDAGLRKSLHPVDAFAKAAREIAHKFRPDGDTRAELMVRPVGSDANQAHRHLILERADYRTGQRRRVYYEKVGELIFTKGTTKRGQFYGFGVQIRDTTGPTSELHDDEREWLDMALATFEDRFQHLLTHMDSHAVRSFVREQLRVFDGVCVKESGGVYFVRQSHADKVAKLGEWIKGIGSQYHGLPLLNLADQREMIMTAFEDETVAEAQRLMAEIADIIKTDRQIEERTFDAYGTQAAELSRRIAQYNDMLGMRAETASLTVQIYTQQLVKLSGQVRPAGQPRRKAA